MKTNKPKKQKVFVKYGGKLFSVIDRKACVNDKNGEPWLNADGRIVLLKRIQDEANRTAQPTVGNAGKKRFWRCEYAEHYYDDFVNTTLCNAPKSRNRECTCRGNTIDMKRCPLFKRGKTSYFITPEPTTFVKRGDKTWAVVENSVLDQFLQQAFREDNIKHCLKEVDQI